MTPDTPDDEAAAPGDTAEITAWLREAGGGDAAASGKLFETVYAELRRIARRQLAASPPNATLSTTALVHEAYLRLSGDSRWAVRDRCHFFALAARAMRHVLVDHARRRGRQKRGGGAAVLDLDQHEVAAPERAEELVALDSALERLDAVDPELARLVEMRYFAGLSVEQIAELLEVSDRTVKRRWRTARAFLYQDLAAQGLRP